LIAVSAGPAVQALWAQGERSLLRTLRSLQAVALPWPQAANFANLNHLAAGQP
jgi:molybdopterin-guanine dinucleotide biosynthesis protein A